MLEFSALLWMASGRANGLSSTVVFKVCGWFVGKDIDNDMLMVWQIGETGIWLTPLMMNISELV